MQPRCKSNVTWMPHIIAPMQPQVALLRVKYLVELEADMERRSRCAPRTQLKSEEGRRSQWKGSKRIKTVPPFPAALTTCVATGTSGTDTIAGNPKYKL